MLIVILTGMLLCSALGATGQELTATPPARTGLGELLSRPLPGTLERADDDAARALQGALAGFAGVASAHVIISRAATEDEDAAPPPRRVALQLGLRDGFSPTPAWTEGLAAFVLRAVPDLDAAQLTIVDAGATVLYESGRSCLVAPPPEASEPARAAAATVTTARWLPAAAVLGCALVIAALVIGRRRPPPEPLPETPPGPLAFVADLSDDDLRRLLADERPELVGLVLAQVPPGSEERVRAAAGLSGAAAGRVDQVSPEVLSAVARALRGKLVAE